MMVMMGSSSVPVPPRDDQSEYNDASHCSSSNNNNNNNNNNGGGGGGKRWLKWLVSKRERSGLIVLVVTICTVTLNSAIKFDTYSRDLMMAISSSNTGKEERQQQQQQPRGLLSAIGGGDGGKDDDDIIFPSWLIRSGLKEMISSSIGDDNTAAIISRQQQALYALYRMKQEKVFDTNFSFRKDVLRYGFQRKWKPCVLERLFRQKEEQDEGAQQQEFVVESQGRGRPRNPLRIVVTGGSPSSRPGSNCSTVDARYSGMLQERFRTEEEAMAQAASVGTTNNNDNSLTTWDNLQFEVINMAQGGAASVLGSLLMDQYFDTSRTDVIIWEFLINDDSSPGGTQEQVRKLDFWLTRVYAHFSQAGRLPPPIVINYLWGYNVGHLLRTKRINDVDYNPLRYTASLIDMYRNELGWDIAVLNIGAAVDNATVVADPMLLFDDGSHPSCAGSRFIGDMLAHLFYSNLALAEGGSDGGAVIDECTVTTTTATDTTTASLSVKKNGNFNSNHDDLAAADTTNAMTTMARRMLPPVHHDQLHPNTTKIFIPGLWEDLFRSDVVVGSFTAWEPQRSNTSKLKYNQQGIQTWTKQIQGKAAPDRQDRKIGYDIPECQDRKGRHNRLNLTLYEPNLKWIGISQSGEYDVYINDVKIPFKWQGAFRWCLCGKYVSQWIQIHNYVDRAEEYTISMCRGKGTAMAHLRFLVGVSVPDAAVAIGNDESSGLAASTV